MTGSTRVALITGASRGLGRSSALKLAEHGVDVVLTYKDNADAARTTAGEIQALGRQAVALRLDMADTGSFAAFAAQLKTTLSDTWQRDHFDYLVNNAGTGGQVPFAETTEAQFDQLAAVHLKGTFFLSQALLPLIADGGRILNTSSGLTRFSLPGYAAYAAMKGGIEVLTRYMARELAPRGIRVNTIAPGAVETDFGDGLVRDNAQVNAHIADATALGRVGLPDDIGGAVAALLSDDNQWITGQRIEVSGGMML